jgi:hypothetical protein
VKAPRGGAGPGGDDDFDSLRSVPFVELVRADADARWRRKILDASGDCLEAAYRRALAKAREEPSILDGDWGDPRFKELVRGACDELEAYEETLRGRAAFFLALERWHGR